MAFQDKLKDPKVQLVAVGVVVVVVVLVAIFASKKVVVDGHECYIMPVMGTVRCGMAHKVVLGIVGLAVVAGIVAFLVMNRKKVETE